MSALICRILPRWDVLRPLRLWSSLPCVVSHMSGLSNEHLTKAGMNRPCSRNLIYTIQLCLISSHSCERRPRHFIRARAQQSQCCRSSPLRLGEHLCTESVPSSCPYSLNKTGEQLFTSHSIVEIKYSGDLHRLHEKSMPFYRKIINIHRFGYLCRSETEPECIPGNNCIFLTGGFLILTIHT